MKTNENTASGEQRRVTILFLCRGSLDDGIGHVTRSRTAAKAMQNMGRVVVAAIGDDYVDNLLMNQGTDYTVLSDDSAAVSFVQDTSPDIVVFDLTHLSPKDFEAIASKRMTVSLSPIFNCISKVDMLFHRTDVLDSSWPFNGDSPIVRHGLQYAIVSDHCMRIEEDVYWRNLQSSKLSIAIAMGGTDASDKTFRVLQTIKALPTPLLIWAMLGEGYSHSYEKLVDSVRGSEHEVILAKTNASMWRILRTCSLVIVAGGITTYEAAYANLPSLNLLDTPEHYFLIQELVDRGVCFCTGKTFDESLSTLNSTLTRLNRNREELFAMHLRAQGLIDSMGASRIADEVLRSYYKKKHAVDAPPRARRGRVQTRRSDGRNR